MLIKHTILLFAALLTGYLISPSYSGDIISCDSFENCPDGSEPLTNQLIQLENKIDALEELLAGVSRGVDPNTGQDTLTFSNMNVQVVNGSGYTSGTTTGTGNLIIGYNELRGSEDVRIGSHMLVLGDTNNYSGFGGIVGGRTNETTGGYASVSGGYRNTASGYASSISGGLSKTAATNNCTVGDDGVDC